MEGEGIWWGEGKGTQARRGEEVGRCVAGTGRRLVGSKRRAHMEEKWNIYGDRRKGQREGEGRQSPCPADIYKRNKRGYVRGRYTGSKEGMQKRGVCGGKGNGRKGNKGLWQVWGRQRHAIQVKGAENQTEQPAGSSVRQKVKFVPNQTIARRTQECSCKLYVCKGQVATRAGR